MRLISFLQEASLRWAYRCFPKSHVENPVERAMRAFEEMTELAQCFHVPKDKLHAIVDKVHERPVGEAFQEVGGVLHTVGILCQGIMSGVQMDHAYQAELLRVLDIPPEKFKKRNEEKEAMGFSHAAPTQFECFRNPRGVGEDEFTYRINGNKVSRFDYLRAGGKDLEDYRPAPMGPR